MTALGSLPTDRLSAPLSLEDEPLSPVHDGYISLKTVVEVSLAAVLLILTAPLLVAFMVLVRLTSPGSAIYRQVRLGRHGRPFTIYKIRTMRHDCERATGPQWSTPGDPRVTPLGRALRFSHLDELPQLVNVLLGQMSLVGPRPERPVFVAELQKAVPEYRRRLAVRPGITGLAQVQLPPDEDVAGVRKKVACDLCYIRLMGPALDARILAATALKVVGVRKALIRKALCLPGVASEGDVAATGIGAQSGSYTPGRPQGRFSATESAGAIIS